MLPPLRRRLIFWALFGPIGHIAGCAALKYTAIGQRLNTWNTFGLGFGLGAVWFVLYLNEFTRDEPWRRRDRS